MKKAKREKAPKPAPEWAAREEALRLFLAGGGLGSSERTFDRLLEAGKIKRCFSQADGAALYGIASIERVVAARNDLRKPRKDDE